MAWYPRPPYPNDILAGALFRDPDGFLLQANSTTYVTEPNTTFQWQMASATTYELLWGPFTYQGSEAGNLLEIQYRITDGNSYDEMVTNRFVTTPVQVFVPMWSRLFFANISGSATLTATFAIRMALGTGSVLINYGSETEPTLMGVRAIGQMDVVSGEEILGIRLI